MPTWDLEYLLLFGPPENKLELLEGRTPTGFPFVDRESADAHFASWAKTLSRWQGVADPQARVEDGRRIKEFGRFKLEQFKRPIRLEVPSVLEAYHWAHGCFWNRRLWPGQPAGFENGDEWSQHHWQIKLNLWNIFREGQKRLGFEGYGIGGVDISLTARDAVQPDYFFYQGPKSSHMIGGDYFTGPPNLVMEVLSPFSRAIDRGPRKDVYRSAGVAQLWLIEPLTRTVELHRLQDGEYRLVSTTSVTEGRSIAVPGIEGLALSPEQVFDIDPSPFEGNPVPESPKAWGIPKGEVVGLQHLILLGHAERRREIWSNQSPCFLAFGSPEEARYRLGQFVLEAARWEQVEAPVPTEIEPNVEAADVGRFHFVRRSYVIRLNVDVSGMLYRELLAITGNRAAWDWGE